MDETLFLPPYNQGIFTLAVAMVLVGFIMVIPTLFLVGARAVYPLASAMLSLALISGGALALVATLSQIDAVETAQGQWLADKGVEVSAKELGLNPLMVEPTTNQVFPPRANFNWDQSRSSPASL